MFAYCQNNPVIHTDPTGTMLVIDDIAALLIITFGIIVCAIMLPLVQQLMWELANGLFTTVDVFIDEIGDIFEARQQGKQRIRHTEYEHLTNEQVSQKARDPKTPPDERKKLLAEEKGRGIRNAQKRASTYQTRIKE